MLLIPEEQEYVHPHVTPVRYHRADTVVSLVSTVIITEVEMA
jgi:hypothetical protein